MAKKYKEITRINELRDKLGNLSELIAVGKNTRDYLAKHPAGTILGLILIGVLSAFVSGAVIKAAIKIISFILKVAAFIYVAKQTLEKFSKFLPGKKLTV